MEENQNKSTEVLSGNSLEAFFTKPKDGDNKGEPKQPANEPKAGEGNEPPVEPKGDPVEPKQPAEPKVNPLEPKAGEPTGQSSFQFETLIKDFIADGDWEDVMVTTEENGEEVEIPITELKNIDKETFDQLRQLQKELKEEEFKEKYISVENLDETTKKMIELKKSGGDISTLIEAEAQYVHPLKNYDLDDERVQEYLVRQKYAHANYEQDYIDMKIKSMKEDLTLDKEAASIVEEINQNFDNFVEQETQRQLAEIEEAKKQQKEFRKTMSEVYKSYDLKDTVAKNILDASTKFDSNGLSDVDKAFFEAKNNPELFAKISFLLTNEDAYNEYMGVKIKNKANLDNVKKVFSLKKRDSKTPNQPKQQKEGLGVFFDNKQ